MKKLLKIFVLIILSLILLRGIIYRQIIKYKSVGVRNEIVLTNQELIKRIENNINDDQISIKKIVNIARNITSKELKFTSKKTSVNPNKIGINSSTNCVGYSATFNSIVNYLIKKNHLEKSIKATHEIGKMELLGNDIHQYFKSPFFKDHDFNKVVNLETGETILIDPTINDYLGIKTVSLKLE